MAWQSCDRHSFILYTLLRCPVCTLLTRLEKEREQSTQDGGLWDHLPLSELDAEEIIMHRVNKR